jgi:hypothetical protein
LPLAQEDMMATESEPVPTSGMQRWHRRTVGFPLFILVLVMISFVTLVVPFVLRLQSACAASHLEFLGARVERGQSGTYFLVSTNRDVAAFLRDGAGDLRQLARWGFVYLDLSRSNATDADLRRLGILRSLFALRVAGTGITDTPLEQLDGSKNIVLLDLSETKVSDAGLAHLTNSPQLGQLSLAHTAITDVGLKHLKGLTKLTSLDLRGTQVTETGATKLNWSMLGCNIERSTEGNGSSARPPTDKRLGAKGK